MFKLFKKIVSILASFLIITLPCETLPCKAVSAKSYALVEQSTGRMIAGQNTDSRLPMASTTKIMTGLIACESGKFDTVFTVPEEAVLVEGSSMGLKAGEKITLRDLTYGLLLESGNDAANTIAYCVSGSVPEFIKKMNAKAQELGLKNTHFVTPSGLDDKNHYTTALDLAKLGACAMRNKDFAKIVSTYKARVTYDGIKDGRVLINHNELLKTYDGAIGIKTGFTKKSGRCLVSCATRNGVTLVAATLHSPDDWNDHKELLDYGFSILKSYPLFSSCPEIDVKVTGGRENKVKCSYDRSLSASLKDGEINSVKMEIKMPKSVRAPVKAGQKIGEIVFTLNGTAVAKTDVVSKSSVAPLIPYKQNSGSIITDFLKSLA